MAIIRTPKRILKKGHDAWNQWQSDLSVLATHKATVSGQLQQMQDSLKLLPPNSEERREYNRSIVQHEKELRRVEEISTLVTQGGYSLKDLQTCKNREELMRVVAKVGKAEAEEQRVQPIPADFVPPKQKAYLDAMERGREEAAAANAQYPEILKRFHGHQERARVEVLKLSRVKSQPTEGEEGENGTQ